MEVPVSVCCISLVWSVKFKITFSEVACMAYSELGSFGWFTVFSLADYSHNCFFDHFIFIFQHEFSIYGANE